MKLFVLIAIIYSSFHEASSSCTFPSALEGSWESPEKGDLVINSTTIIGYDIDTYTSLVFTCEASSGNYYVIRSDDFTVLSNTVNAALCLDLTEQSTNTYSYFVLTDELADANYERVRFISSTAATLTTSEICNATTVVNTLQETKIMIKNGTASSSKVQCPDVYLATMYYVNDTTCSASSWDVCTAVTDMTIDYTACSTTQCFSSTGYVYCVYGATSGSLSLAYVYNNDSSVDNSATFQFTCLIAESSSGLIYMSQNPKACYKNQTSTWAPTAGKTIILGANVTCVPSTASEETSQAGLVAGLVILFLALIVGGAVVGYVVYTKKFKKVEPEKARVIDREKSVASAEAPTNAVTPSVVHADMHEPRVSGSHVYGSRTDTDENPPIGTVEDVAIKVLSPPTVGKIKVKRVPLRRDNGPSAPVDTKHRPPRRRIDNTDRRTLITPQTLKTPRNRTLPKIPEAPKVEEAPVPLQLNLDKEDTLPPQAPSRASTLCEDKISLSLQPETSRDTVPLLTLPTPTVSARSTKVTKAKPVTPAASSRKQTPATPQRRPTPATPQRRPTPQSRRPTPATSQSRRRNIPSISVKPLQKPATRKIHTNVVYKDSTTIYKKKVRLVGKVQKKRQAQAPALVTIKEPSLPKQTSTPTKKHREIYKKIELDLSGLVKELKRPGEKLTMEPSTADKPTTDSNGIKPIVKEVTDDNFFSPASYGDMPDDESKDTVKNIKPTTCSAIEDINEQSDSVFRPKPTGLRSQTQRKTTTDFFSSMMKQMERVAQRSAVRDKIKRELSMHKTVKKKQEADVQKKVLSQVVYNHGLKHSSTIKQKQRRRRRHVQIPRDKDFKRLPTLIKWVECSDILRTPAMRMQNSLTDGSINRDVSANIRFSRRSTVMSELTDIDD